MTETASQGSAAPDPEALKRDAARVALERVRSGMRLGLGTGSTMRHFVELLGEAMAEGRITDLVTVATSIRTAEQAEGLGIPVLNLAQAQPLDLAVDGADEVSPGLDLIKGLGGALLREKMVVQAAERFVVIVDERKQVDRLGTRSPLPVEVVPFAWDAHLEPFRGLGAVPELRLSEDDSPYLTDNGNHVIDLSFPDGIETAGELDLTLLQRAGVVETGLFLGLADEVIVASPEGVTVLSRGDS